MQIIIIIILYLFLNLQITKAQVNDPIEFLTNIINESKNKLQNEGDCFIEKKIEKHIDFYEVSTLIVGYDVWKNMNNEEKKTFINEIKKLILKTYKKTVYMYVDSEIELEKPKQFNNEIKKIQIYSKIKKNNKIININYRLIKKDNSWFLFDVIIEGISMIKSFKSQFEESIKFYGITNTINKIHEINNKK